MSARRSERLSSQRAKANRAMSRAPTCGVSRVGAHPPKLAGASLGGSRPAKARCPRAGGTAQHWQRRSRGFPFLLAAGASRQPTHTE